jgi:hypothetical protein
VYHPCKLKILSNHDPKKPAEHFFFGDIFEQRYYQVYKYYCGKELEIAAISGQEAIFNGFISITGDRLFFAGSRQISIL